MSGDLSVNEAIARCKNEIQDLQMQIAQKLPEEKEEDLDYEYPLPLYLKDRFPDLKKPGTNTKPDFKAVNTLKGHFGKVYAMHWSEDNINVVSASQDGKLIIWNAIQGSKFDLIHLRSSWVMTCAYSPGPGKFVACGGLDNICSVYRLSNGLASNGPGHSKAGTHAELAQHEGYLSCCRFVDENEIITSSGDTTCILWDIETNREKQSFHGHDGDVMSVSVTEDGRQFVSGSCDSFSKLWDVRQNGANGACVKTFKGHTSDINCVQYFPDYRSFGTASDDASCRLFDLRSYRQMNKFSDEKVPVPVTSIAFTQSGRMLWAGYDDHMLHVWDTVRPRRVAGGHNSNATNLVSKLMSAHETRVSCLGISKNGQAVCSGSWDTFLKIWALQPGK